VRGGVDREMFDHQREGIHVDRVLPKELDDVRSGPGFDKVRDLARIRAEELRRESCGYGIRRHEDLANVAGCE
jgi:hypothetical protein